jgi:hypothetical protein
LPISARRPKKSLATPVHDRAHTMNYGPAGAEWS